MAKNQDMVASKPEKTRRTNPERTAHTRSTIMEVVIDILSKQGFDALSNAQIIEKAGVSSGALMYHFPSRTELLVEMVDFAYKRVSTFRTEKLAKLEKGLPQYRALVDITWATARMPEGISVNEVRISARSHPDLAAAVSPKLTEIADDYGRFVGRVARDAGITSDQSVRGLAATTGLSIRSLAIDRMTYPSPEMVENVLFTLRSRREDIIAAQLGSEHRIDPSISAF